MTNRRAALQRRNGVTAAALTAAIVLVVALVQNVLSTISSFFVYWAQIATSNDGWFFSAFFRETALILLPFAVGVFLCVWLLAPVAGELRVREVIVRSLLAAVAGAVLVFVVALAGSLFSGFDVSAGLVYGWAAGAVTTAAGNIGWAVTQSAYSAVNFAISLAPLTVLAGVLVWFWLRARPVAVSVANDSAEV